MTLEVRVVEGDTIPSIAHEHRVLDWHRLWNAPENAQLKAQRDPMLLYPGDVVVLPDPTPKTESVATNQLHRFKVRATSPLWLRLIVHDVNGAPLPAGAPFELKLGDDLIGGELQSGGLLVAQVPWGLHDAKLTVEGRSRQLLLGYLDPLDTVEGVWARLVALGFLEEDVQPEPTDAFTTAVMRFQAAHGLQIDGVVGPQTRRKLQEAFGC